MIRSETDDCEGEDESADDVFHLEDPLRNILKDFVVRPDKAEYICRMS